MSKKYFVFTIDFESMEALQKYNNIIVPLLSVLVFPNVGNNGFVLTVSGGFGTDFFHNYLFFFQIFPDKAA